MLSTSGLEKIDPSSQVPCHSHRRNPELLFIYSGKALLKYKSSQKPVPSKNRDKEADLEYKTENLESGSLVFVPTGVEHCLENKGEEELKLLWAFSGHQSIFGKDFDFKVKY